MVEKSTDSPRDATAPAESEKISPQEIESILARARQVVKPIVNRETSTEIVSDDILSFRMKKLGKPRE